MKKFDVDWFLVNVYLLLSIVVLAFLPTRYGYCSGVDQPSKYQPGNVTITGGTINGITSGSNTFTNLTATGVLSAPYIVLNGASAGDAYNWSIQTSYNLAGKRLFISNLPTIPAGSNLGTTATITSINGTATFEVAAGTPLAGTGATINMPAATNGWNCIVQKNGSAMTPNIAAWATSLTTTSIGFSNYNVATGLQTAFVNGDQYTFICMGF
jgi:hypothetical protein